VTLGWQDLVAIGIVLAACGYLLSLGWNAVRRKQVGGCGATCGGCGARTSIAPLGRESEAPELVSISLIGPQPERAEPGFGKPG
jgi:hypothetical protein